MKVLQIHNEYRYVGGEDFVVKNTVTLLREREVQVTLLLRSSRGLDKNLSGKLLAFCSGIYSRSAHVDVRAALHDDRPDVVHVHNLYPLFSPSVLVACRRAGVPVVMSVHNHRLTCPRADHLYRDKICERCVGGREYFCVLQNCRRNLPESAAYALRSTVARKLRLFRDNVTVVIALTDFAKRRLLQMNYADEQVVVLPNMVNGHNEALDPAAGGYVAFGGRLHPEKGLDTLLAAARQMPGFEFRIAGGGPLLETLTAHAPANVRVLGLLPEKQMTTFYRGARFLVLPSIAFEMCPLVVCEAMSHGLPVIASRIGGLPELVEDGVTGLTFQPGNPDDLARSIQRLWDDPAFCRRLGRAAHHKAQREHSKEIYYHRLMDIYKRAIDMHRSRRSMNGSRTVL